MTRKETALEQKHHRASNRMPSRTVVRHVRSSDSFQGTMTTGIRAPDEASASSRTLDGPSVRLATAYPRILRSGTIAMSAMARVLDAGPRAASRRSAHASRARLMPGGGVPAPATDARTASTHAALTRRPRTPAAISFEDYGKRQVTAFDADVLAGTKLLEPGTTTRQRCVEQRGLGTGCPVVAAVEQPRLQQRRRHPRLFMADDIA